MPQKKPSVLIADDHPMMAEGLRKLLEPGFRVLGVVHDGRALLDAAARERPDVVVTDVTMPGVDGIEATRRLKRADPGLRVIVLSVHGEPVWVRQAFAAGADGYLAKSAAPGELEEALREVLEGGVYAGPAVARTLAGDAGGEALTPRELDAVRLVAEGLSNQEIADRLGVSPLTVRSHLSHVYGKLGLANRVELALYAVRAGWVALAGGGDAGPALRG